VSSFEYRDGGMPHGDGSDGLGIGMTGGAAAGSLSAPAAVARSYGDYYLIILAVVLAGYAIFGKNFAYLGFPPLYVGEIAFLLGIVAFVQSRCVIATLVNMPMLLLSLLMAWVLLRTLPFIGHYGINAVRDSVIVMYGGFAFIVVALMLQKPERLPVTLSFLQILGLFLIPLTPFLIMMSDDSYTSVTGESAVAYVKIGTTGVHIAAAMLMMLLGFWRPRFVWIILLIIGMAVVASQGRGGMLAMGAMLGVAVLVTGRFRAFAAVFALAVVILGVAYAMDLSIPTPRGRNMGAAQVLDNFLSIFDVSNHNLDSTKQWREQWWRLIYTYTFDGPYFWGGKGFGVNLTIDDGVTPAWANALVPILRSPHNGHVTILARAGVPGFTLWLLMLTSWGVMMLKTILVARRRGDTAWSNFLLLTFCYLLGFAVDATFDVTLEGPMAGIWFWCLFGVGVGGCMIYRAERQSLAPIHATNVKLAEQA
jgi:hypothetical protein